ncbi:Ureidoglycolate lyase [Thalassoglobus neptunius]|uniref:Ureidoglycolate lyase n=2 Tax=Thalassoglobus neptunius TaxID=1938619 RepID=A0A5C5VXZ0_9PLAN|nr:Ureidoglycolate lyase [Thalassoglobus neptunius]
MRLCRFELHGAEKLGVYQDETVLELKNLQQEFGLPADHRIALVDFLPGGQFHSQLQALMSEPSSSLDLVEHAHSAIKLLVPIPNPSKLLLLAGNYAKHVEERGDVAEERARTFPYVFMKPPTTTLTHPHDPIQIPKASPDQIDWELELGVVIGQRCSNVSEENALAHVAGYTIVNDITDRNFRPNPDRAERPRDKFFDWLHGKWHDTFCPMGPCVTSATEIPDPQSLAMSLRANGEVEQNASTSEMVFPVASVISFISQFVTLEPGDIISTGTPAGVGHAKARFLRPGDHVAGTIEKIGILENPVVASPA